MGAQNRHQEAPKEDRKRYRKKKNEKRGEEEHQEWQRELQKALPQWPGNKFSARKRDLSSLVGQGPQGAAIFVRSDKHSTINKQQSTFYTI